MRYDWKNNKKIIRFELILEFFCTCCDINFLISPGAVFDWFKSFFCRNFLSKNHRLSKHSYRLLDGFFPLVLMKKTKLHEKAITIILKTDMILSSTIWSVESKVVLVFVKCLIK